MLPVNKSLIFQNYCVEICYRFYVCAQYIMNFTPVVQAFVVLQYRGD